MAITDWDHNRWYHRLLLRQVAPGAERGIDIGCGAGTLAGRVAAVVPRVEAVDRPPAMIAEAARTVPSNVTLHLADLRALELPDGKCDAVLSSAVLHSLDLTEALPRMAGCSGRVVCSRAVAVPRIDLPRDLPVELGAAVAHRALGVTFAALGPLSGARLFRREPSHDVMPVAEPTLTTREVRATAVAVLPGVRVRRLLLWRYLLTWRATV